MEQLKKAKTEITARHVFDLTDCKIVTVTKREWVARLRCPDDYKIELLYEYLPGEPDGPMDICVCFGPYPTDNE